MNKQISSHDFNLFAIDGGRAVKLLTFSCSKAMLSVMCVLRDTENALKINAFACH